MFSSGSWRSRTTSNRPDPAGDATIAFCVGATKGGTTWLYQYLSNHPDCHIRSIKELHYFNAIDRGTLQREIRKHEDRRAVLQKQLAASRGAESERRSSQLMDRTEWLDVLAKGEDPDAYVAYLNGGRGMEAVVGDFTPAYGLLSEKRLRSMTTLARRVRFIFLLRDPVDRLWSHVRMMAARRDPSGRATAERTARILERTLRGAEEQIAMRSDYVAIMTRLKAAVGPRLLVAFSDDLFEGDGARRICDHLGIGEARSDHIAVSNEGQHLDMTAEQRHQARAWLGSQYDFVRAEMGSLPASWQAD